jgi:hypothetical protein
MKPRRKNSRAEWIAKLYADGNPKLKNKPVPVVQEPAPELFDDLIWVWEAYCFLSERRGIGPGGPVPITTTDIMSYCTLTGRDEQRYRAQCVMFIPALDRVYLKDFYDKQAEEMEKNRKKSEAKSRQRR